jgi:eukaryotic-like serine/threonine-protein kinase
MTDDPLIGKQLGAYQVEQRLGQGAMGVVYRGKHLSLERTIAIKILLPQWASDSNYVQRFLNEAKAAAQLNHCNIVQIYDASMVDDIYFYVMEFVEGKDLSKVLAEQGFIDEIEALKLIQQAASGLAFAHKRGIVHRDIKPENLILTEDRVLKIGDLGLAKVISKDGDQGLTMTGVMMGTPYYISPEQIRGARDIDGRADIYSLGMTLYHLIAGRPPFPKGTAGEVISKHLTEEPPPLKRFYPKVSKETTDLIAKMIVKDREKRISKIDDVYEEVTNMVGVQHAALTPGVPKFSSSPHFEKSAAARNQRFAAMGIVMGLFMLVLVVWGTKHWMSVDREEATVIEETVEPSNSEKFFSAAADGDLETLQSLLKSGVDVNLKNADGKTALMIATDNGSLEEVQLLLQQGANVNVQDPEGRTPLAIAKQNEYSEIAELLTKAGAR